MPNATFIEAHDDTLTLTKTYKLDEDGNLISSPYPLVRDVDSYRESFSDISQLHDLVLDYAARGAALLTGHLKRELVNESRAGMAEKDVPLDFLVFDFDDIDGVSLDQAEQALNLTDVSRIRAYSASSGMPGHENDLNVHIIVVLTEPLPAEMLKRWLRHKNFEVALFNNRLLPTVNGHALKYPLDVALGEPSRLVYIAPPVFQGEIIDPHYQDRITFIKGDRPTYTIDPDGIPTRPALTRRTNTRLDELCLVHNIRQPTDRSTRQVKGYDGLPHDLIVSPGEMHIEQVSHSNGFVRINVNNGDSGAYYFPEDTPTYVYNFKGEPVFRLEVANPAFYREAIKTARRIKAERKRAERINDVKEAEGESRVMLDELSGTHAETDPVHFFCIDDKTGEYKVGSYDPDTNTVHLRSRRNSQQLTQFAQSKGLPEPELYTPNLSIIFDPTDPKNAALFQRQTAHNDGTINLYCPSKYLLNGVVGDPYDGPPGTYPESIFHIHQLVAHLMGDSPEFINAFYNWWAFIIQTGRKTQTSWIISTVPGTGKDTFIDHVVRPLIGEQQCMSKRLDQLEDKFDGEMQHTQVLWVNEAGLLEKNPGNQKLVDYLKDMTTAEKIGLRAMYNPHAMSQSFVNILMGTNSRSPFPIEADDRRWWVPPRQEKPLRAVRGEDVGRVYHNKLKSELQAFTNFLLSWEIDEDLVRVPIYNEAKENLQVMNRDTPTELSELLRAGLFDGLVAMLPSPEAMESGMSDPVAAQRSGLTNYINVLLDIAEELNRSPECTAQVPLSRDQFMALFAYYCGGTWLSKPTGKFVKAIAHYGWDFQYKRTGVTNLIKTKNGHTQPGYMLGFEASEDMLNSFLRYYTRKYGELTLVSS